MNTWKNEEELFHLIKTELFTTVIGDIMDKMGYLHQFLPSRIQPLRNDFLLAGRAMPVLEADCFEEVSASGNNASMEKPFDKLIAQVSLRTKAFIIIAF